MKKRKTSQEGNQGEPIQVHDREALIEEYVAFRKLYGSLADSTLKQYKFHLNQFFDWLDFDNSPERLGRLDFQALQQFVVAYAKTHSSQEGMHCALRSLLTFCCIEGYLPMDLSASIPSVRKRRLARVPFIIDEESLERLFESIDRSKPAGKRDYAILMMMATYGVRGVQVRRLKLEDLFWRQARILFQPVKGGLAVEQPLVAEVSDPLLDYLLNARPESGNYREVFLTNLPPIRPLAHSEALSNMVARRLQRAQIQVPDNARKGSHLFRHTFASRLLASGTPLSHIADMLGHRSQSSTLIYTKIDFKKLMNVAQEWPVVLS